MPHRKKTSRPDLSWRQAGQCVLAQGRDYNRTSFLSIMGMPGTQRPGLVLKCLYGDYGKNLG
jgi:hypothetical protein